MFRNNIESLLLILNLNPKQMITVSNFFRAFVYLFLLYLSIGCKSENSQKNKMGSILDENKTSIPACADSKMIMDSLMNSIQIKGYFSRTGEYDYRTLIEDRFNYIDREPADSLCLNSLNQKVICCCSGIFFDDGKSYEEYYKLGLGSINSEFYVDIFEFVDSLARKDGFECLNSTIASEKMIWGGSYVIRQRSNKLIVLSRAAMGSNESALREIFDW